MNRLRLITHVLSLLAIFAAAFAFIGEETVRITQIDTSQFPRVTFYVSVTDANGDPLAVDSSRFVITENGQEISPDQITGVGEVGFISTMLVMDVSGSMEVEGKLDSAKAAAHEFVSRMRSQDQAGLISFNTQTEVVQGLTSNKETLDEAIDSLVADDDTAMYDALMVAVQQLEEVGGRKAIIVLTDGLDNSSSANINNVTNAIGPEGISISTAGLGVPGGSNMTGIDEPGLEDLADRAGGVYGYAENQDALTNLYENYAVALQSEYAVTYTSPAALRDGVNRSLGVSLAPIGGAGELVANQDTRYNPGGLVPEVAQPASWPLFAAVVLALAALVLVPMALTNFRGGSTEASGRSAGKSSGVRLKKQQPSRIKLK
jgi:VWFA-related protein